MMRPAYFFRLISLLLLALLTNRMQAQELPGFGSLNWGDNFAKVKAAGNMGNTNLVMVREADLVHVEWNAQEVAKATGFVVAPPAHYVRFEGPGSERIEYILGNNQLGLVVHRPRNSLAFSPDKALAGIDDKFGNATDRRERVDVPLPDQWGRFDKRTEYCLTIDWESTTGIVRAFCRTWPINDKRQIYWTYYMSKTQVSKNQQRLKQWEIEEAARKAEIARKAEEEAEKRRAAAAAAKAAKAAAKAGAAQP